MSPPGGSTLMICAPKSPSIVEANGPASACERSMTVTSSRGSTLDLRVAATARRHAAALPLVDPAELLQDLLAVRDAPAHLLDGLGREQEGGLRHEERCLAFRIV